MGLVSFSNPSKILTLHNHVSQYCYYMWAQVICTEVERMGAVILACMQLFSDVMQGWLDFSSIYIIGQPT